ncbi:MAG TPA: DotU family type IV/VI secretion system protein [Terriglobales bacterium]|nr:DotU family type IV/VI secretion system protein [Terriglobales bacterium]
MGATMFGATSLQPQEQSSRKRRPYNLGLIYQEILTAVVRVRTNRQAVSDAGMFRSHMQNALKVAEKEAIKGGYSPEDIRTATTAVVAFLDESVLNSSNPAFSGWSSMPLQEELFGHHIAGETFFENLDKLFSSAESQDVADLLEVHLLCLLLGYKGRYGLAGPEGTRSYIETCMDKIRRIRGPLTGLSPSWAVPQGGSVARQADPWVRRLMWAAIISVSLSLVLLIGFKLQLVSGSNSIHAMTMQSHP